jgi:hypothetical protein
MAGTENEKPGIHHPGLDYLFERGPSSGNVRRRLVQAAVEQADGALLALFNALADVDPYDVHVAIFDQWRRALTLMSVAMEELHKLSGVMYNAEIGLLSRPPAD